MALLKSLNEFHVPESIIMKDLENIIRQISANNTITFLEEELTLEGTRHTKSLHIAVDCWGMVIVRVLI